MRISCAGFPTKMLYEDFVDHFWNLVPHLLARADLSDASIAKAIAKRADLEGYQAGKTKAGRLTAALQPNLAPGYPVLPAKVEVTCTTL